MDDALAQFVSITGTKPETAQQYLSLTDGDVQQAIELFFVNDSAESAVPVSSTQAASSYPPPIPDPSTRPVPTRRSRQDSDGIVHIDSDESDPDYSEATSHRRSDSAKRQAGQSERVGSLLNTQSIATPPIRPSTTGVEDDEAFARQLQQEMYGEAGIGDPMNPEGIRAPIARTTQTLVGPDSFDPDDPDDMQSAVLHQLRARQGPRPRDRPGIFNQSTAESPWDPDDLTSSNGRDRSSRAPAGASETTSKQRELAMLYRPPFNLITRVKWDQARQMGKEQEKWILVNIQDMGIFDCQILNRDVWKDPGVVETVKENFIFMQYAKDDPEGGQYIQYYFQNRDDQDAYPHVAIVDPRTGEQVKVWSGPPVPKALEFLQQLHEFLDRYSLKVSAKNPVAKRKPEVKKETQIEKMTEEQMLEMAMQNSLAGNGAKREHDPDDLTRIDLHGGSTAGPRMDRTEDAEQAQSNGASKSLSVFASIPATNTHTEPAPDPSTTRIQFRHPNGRVVRRFTLSDPVKRIYEWLKASPLEGREGVEFELVFMQRNLIDALGDSIEQAGLKNGTVMVEFLEA
ncbi:MAG: hypothetical protein Q9174_006608 [Haloplaca sp. 1 TL-2023]